MSSFVSLRLHFWIVLATVIFLRLLFLNQAIQGDDVYYLAGAQHALIDPLHPHHAKYAFNGDMVDMRGHPHPPLNTWALAGLLAIFGDVYEVRFHAAYIAFSLIAAASLWSLARRFSPRPLWACLLLVATPAFVVNGTSLEADVPLLAFWLASVALWVRAVDGGSRRVLAFAGAAMVLAVMTAYQAAVLVPILALYLWQKRRGWLAGWAAIAAVPVVMLGWQVWERMSSGSLPATVLAGYLQQYGLQQVEAKLRNAAALLSHLGWVVFPALTVVSLRQLPRVAWLAVGVFAACGLMLDVNPLFWASWAVGALVLLWCATHLRTDEDTRFLSAWVLIFFAASLLLFFAGSARYLLPLVAPVALLVTRVIPDRRTWLAAGVAAQLIVSLGLAWVNYKHWQGYRVIEQQVARDARGHRLWINGEWGLRFYAEADGGLPVLRGQAFRPGDVMVASRLAYPVALPASASSAPLGEWGITSRVPLRLIGLGVRSGYSTASLGLRPFDVSQAPLDVVTATTLRQQQPTQSNLPMSAPEAGQQIVSGIYGLEDQWRWMGERGVLLLKRPAQPAPLRVVVYLPEAARAKRLTASVDGIQVAEQVFGKPGMYTLTSQPVQGSGDSAVVTLQVDQTFQAPGDGRSLGVILASAGFAVPADTER